MAGLTLDCDYPKFQLIAVGTTYKAGASLAVTSHMWHTQLRTADRVMEETSFIPFTNWVMLTVGPAC